MNKELKEELLSRNKANKLIDAIREKCTLFGILRKDESRYYVEIPFTMYQEHYAEHLKDVTDCFGEEWNVTDTLIDDNYRILIKAK